MLNVMAGKDSRKCLQIVEILKIRQKPRETTSKHAGITPYFCELIASLINCSHARKLSSLSHSFCTQRAINSVHK